MYGWGKEEGEHVERRDVCLREVGSRQGSLREAGQLTLSTLNDWGHW